ncbi:hypothetical protein F2Q68_00006869 [Brassica cretica]|uniref:Uncharacterized protein n=1 Tax=Brassica cretica TaxID=69181 RepID=A0A8S9JNF8_BRACR|nr:hypothetical protein F2Q68_00006869 [Brassica cretica]
MYVPAAKHGSATTKNIETSSLLLHQGCTFACEGDIWPVGANGPLEHLVCKDIWSARISGPLGRLVRWDIRPVGASSPLGHPVRWDIWPVGASGPLGHLACWDIRLMTNVWL